MYAEKIQKLIDLFSKLPGIGPRVASRFVFYLAKARTEEVDELAKAILDIKHSLRICRFCFKLFEPSSRKKQSEDGLCEVCSNNSRNRNLLCVVGKEIDLISIEKTKLYNGLYFILGGSFSALERESMDRLRLKDLRERIKNPLKSGLKADFKEIILALNPTVDGETTSLYLERELKDLNKKITRLGRGLPTGGELEYADKKTISSAFEGRK